MKRMAFVAIWVVLASGQAVAKVTPSDVYQVTQNIVIELEAAHHRNFTKPKYPSLNLTSRRPRHAFEKAREVFQKVQALRYINGLPPRTLEPFPVRDVTPADVLALSEKVLSDIRDLRGVYGVAEAPPPAALQAGKSPTDVYGNLVRVSASLDGLGIPSVVPNDVFQIATTVLNELNKIQKQKTGIMTPVSSVPVSGKSPGEVYDEVYVLLQKLQKLGENKQFAIKGGVVLPNKPKGAISPSHVLNIINLAMAEVGALKQVTGVSTPTTLARMQAGQTPSNVYQQVKRAQNVVEALRAKADSLNVL